MDSRYISGARVGGCQQGKRTYDRRKSCDAGHIHPDITCDKSCHAVFEHIPDTHCRFTDSEDEIVAVVLIESPDCVNCFQDRRPVLHEQIARNSWLWMRR
jgi:hypothetical protein